MTWHTHERAALVDALTAAGPDAPTLCEGWTARHLAAHIVLRERRPWEIAGEVLPTARDWTKQKMATYGGIGADAPDAAASWEQMLHDIEVGPAAWSPFSWAGEWINAVEFFVHTEDVRRGGGDDTPRDIPEGLNTAIWQSLSRSKAMFSHGLPPVGVLLAVPGGPQLSLKPPTEGRWVVVSGEPCELALFAFGRGEHAHVTLRGSESDIAELSQKLPVPATPGVTDTAAL